MFLLKKWTTNIYFRIIPYIAAFDGSFNFIFYLFLNQTRNDFFILKQYGDLNSGLVVGLTLIFLLCIIIYRDQKDLKIFIKENYERKI